MTLQLQHIFPGIGMGRRKIKGNALIDLDTSGIEKAGQGSKARFRNAAGQAACNRSEFRAGQPYDTNATTPGRGGDGGNEISWLSACHPRSRA